jgi:hypothetical protein
MSNQIVARAKLPALLILGFARFIDKTAHDLRAKFRALLERQLSASSFMQRARLTTVR